MKILFPFVGDSIGGSHLSTIALYDHLKQNGYDVVIVLHYKQSVLANYLNKQKIKYKTLNAPYLAGSSPKIIMIFFGMILNSYSFIKFIKNNNIDIVHGNDLRINLSWSIASKLSNTKYVWHQRTILSTSVFWKCIAYLCDHFIASSKVVFSSSPRNISANRKSLIYNAFNTDKKYDKHLTRESMNTNYPNCKNKFLIGYVGRLIDYKNIKFLIECLPEVINKGKKSFHLLIVGNGKKEYVSYLKQITNKFNLRDNIDFVGFVNDPVELISGLDLLVASSGVDAFGRTIVESMLQSTPVLAANKGGHLEVIEDKVDGLLYEVNCKSSFTDKILKLADDPSYGSGLTKKALKKCSSLYTKDNMLKGIERVYRSLI